MGHKNADRVPLSYRRVHCETVADMVREGWDVLSQCGHCGLVMLVIARVSGAETSLWNRKGRCRRLGCIGLVDFLAKAPGMYSHEALQAPWPEEKPSRRGE